MTNPNASNTCTVDVNEMMARLVPIDARAVATAYRDEPTGEWRVSVEFVSDTVTVDREGGYGWHLGPKHQRLAARLVNAINAGAVFSDFRMGTDINGNTYITANANVRGRAINADLNAIGY